MTKSERVHITFKEYALVSWLGAMTILLCLYLLA